MARNKHDRKSSKKSASQIERTKKRSREYKKRRDRKKHHIRKCAA